MLHIFFPGELWGYLQEFRGEKLANKPEKLYLFIRQAHYRAKEIQDAVNAVGECDFDDDEEASHEKRKIDEIEEESNGADEKSGKELEEQPAKKVKVEEDENTVDNEENILENSPGSLDEKCEKLSVNANDTMEVEACEKGQASNEEVENKSELNSEEPKVEILNEFEKNIENSSETTSEETLQNDDEEPLTTEESKLDEDSKTCKESPSLFDILETETMPEPPSKTTEKDISQISSTTSNEPSSSTKPPEVQKPPKRKITQFFKPLEKP